MTETAADSGMNEKERKYMEKRQSDTHLQDQDLPGELKGVQTSALPSLSGSRSPFELWGREFEVILAIVAGLLYVRGVTFFVKYVPLVVGFWLLSFYYRRWQHIVHDHRPLSHARGMVHDYKIDKVKGGRNHPHWWIFWQCLLGFPILIIGIILVPTAALAIAVALPVATVIWTSLADYKPSHPLNPIVYWLATPLRWSETTRRLLPSGIPAQGWNRFHLMYCCFVIPIVGGGVMAQHFGTPMTDFYMSLPGVAVFPVGALGWLHLRGRIHGRWSFLGHYILPGVSTNHWKWEQNKQTLLSALYEEPVADPVCLEAEEPPEGPEYVQETVGRLSNVIDYFRQTGSFETPIRNGKKLEAIGGGFKETVEPEKQQSSGSESSSHTMDSNGTTTETSGEESIEEKAPDSAATADFQASSSTDAQRMIDRTAPKETLDRIGEDMLFDWRQPPDVTFGAIGGYGDVKETLTEDVMEPMKAENPYYDKFDIKPDHGILFYGPPGTGKTLFARALAGMLNKPFVKLDQSRLSDWRVDSMPQKIGQLFDEAGLLEGVIFIDEIDQLVAKRGDTGGNNKQQKVTNAFLTRIDEEDDPDFILMGTTNRPDMIDEAMLRPGRFGKQIEIGKPDAEARHAILQTKIQDYIEGHSMEGLDAIVGDTEGWTGDELDTLVEQARKNAADERADELRIEHFPDDLSAALQ